MRAGLITGIEHQPAANEVTLTGDTAVIGASHWSMGQPGGNGGD